MSDTPATHVPSPAAPATAALSGIKVVKSIGPGNLRKGAGKEARRMGEAIFCGTLTGLIWGSARKANRANPEQQSVVFYGDFLAITADGEQVRPMELYVPSLITGTFEVMAAKNDGAIRFAIDVYAEPDESPTNTIGYRYGVRDRLAARQVMPALELAYEVGVLARPAPQIEHSSSGTDFDPETGEVRSVEAVSSRKGRRS